MSNFQPEFLGTEFFWWIGRVEYINDPAQMGRVKVRIFGYHLQDTEKVPTDKLPWCYTIHPTTSAAHSGVGNSPTGLRVGSWVIGFFLDGRKGQYPAVFGTWHGIHASQDIPAGGGSGGAGSNAGGLPSDGLGSLPGDAALKSLSQFGSGGGTVPPNGTANFGKKTGALGVAGKPSLSRIYTSDGKSAMVNSAVARKFSRIY